MKKIIIFGDGKVAEAIFDLAQQISNIKVVAFTVDKVFLRSHHLLGIPVLPYENIREYIDIKEHYFVTAISYKNLNRDRENIYYRLKKDGAKFINLIHETAICRFDKIGENNIIFEFNNFQKGTEIGNNSIFWSSNHFGHHSKINDNCFISSHVVISGSVTINSNSFIGVNSTVKDNITIGKNCIIGASSTVLKNVADFSVIKSENSIISKISSEKIK